MVAGTQDLQQAGSQAPLSLATLRGDKGFQLSFTLGK